MNDAIEILSWAIIDLANTAIDEQRVSEQLVEALEAVESNADEELRAAARDLIFDVRALLP